MLRRLLSIALFPLLAACSSPSGSEPNTTAFSVEEAREFLGALNESMGFDGSLPRVVSPKDGEQTAARVLAPANLEIKDRLCPAGGTTRLTRVGTLTIEANGEETFDVVHAACNAKGTGIRRITFTGAPSMRLRSTKSGGNLTVSTPTTLRSTYTGAVRYVGTDRSGVCNLGVDIVTVLSINAAGSISATRRLQGSVCGSAIDTTRTL